MKSWLPFWFDLPFVFIVSSLCLHHPPFRKPLSDSIFLPFLPPFCPPFIHFMSEACRGISGSVKQFGSIASSFHLRYHPPLFVILVWKSNIVSPIFSCLFLKIILYSRPFSSPQSRSSYLITSPISLSVASLPTPSFSCHLPSSLLFSSIPIILFSYVFSYIYIYIHI